MASSRIGSCEIRFLKMISAVCGSEFTITVRKQSLPDHFAALVANMLQRPSQKCQGEMPNTQQISISYYSNSHGPDRGVNMAAKGELQQPSCVCVCGFTHEWQPQHLGSRL